MSHQPLPPTPPEKKSSVLPDARWVCYFIIGFTGYLFATKPVNTTAQLIFRLALLATAMVGLFVIWCRRKKSGSQPRPLTQNRPVETQANSLTDSATLHSLACITGTRTWRLYR